MTPAEVNRAVGLTIATCAGLIFALGGYAVSLAVKALRGQT